MINDVVTYNQAQKLAELMYNDYCYAYYTEQKELVGRDFAYTAEGNIYDSRSIVNNTEIISWKSEHDSNNYTLWFAAPLRSTIFKWFRKEYGLFATVYPSSDLNSFYYIIVYNPGGLTQKIYNEVDEKGNPQNYFLSEDEAEICCIDKLIEIAKEKGRVRIIKQPAPQNMENNKETQK